MSKVGQIFPFTVLFCFTTASISCSGYQFKRNRNPFASDGIGSVAIPMFINHSIVPHVAGPMTKEITLLLSRYPGLKVYQGERQSAADGTLLGIISSAPHHEETFSPSQFKYTESAELSKSIGERNKFFIPTRTNYALQVRFVLIKRSTKKMIFNRELKLSTSFSRVVAPNLPSNPDSGGPVNFTQSQGNFHKSIQELSKSAAENFKRLVLDVF